MEDSKIMITLLKPDVGIVWNKDDVIRLKRELRIPGILSGSLPRKPWQNQVMSLPLMLMPEEVSLLLRKGLAYMARKDVGSKSVSEQVIRDFKALRDKSHSDQVQLFVQERENKIRQHRLTTANRVKSKEDEYSKHLCLEQKNYDDKEKRCIQFQCIDSLSREKLPTLQQGDNRTGTQGFGTELVTAKDRKYYSKATWVHVPTKVDNSSPLSQSDPNSAKVISWRYPLSAEEKSRYAVFCDLWEKGYYITNGAKFGSDYLLYPGDPSSYHSNFIVKVISSIELCSPHELLAYGRLASAVKKTFVLAIVNEDDFNVKYNSISWTSVE